MLVTTPLALTGSAAPLLWLGFARATGLAALVVVYALTARLGGRWAGVIAVVATLLTTGWIREFAHGYTEPLSIGLLLAAVVAHLEHKPRIAIVLGGLIALGRPEALVLLAAYGVILRLRGERVALVTAGTLVAVVALWIVPDWIGSGDPMHASKVARLVVPTGYQASVNAVSGAARIVSLPLLACAAGAVVIAVRRRDWTILGMAGLALVWSALLAGMMFLADYPASIRFFALPTALLCVVGAVGAVQLVELLPARRLRPALAAILLAVGVQSAVLRTISAHDEAQASITRATFEQDLSSTVRAARDRIKDCGIPVVPAGLYWAKGVVAWDLDLPLRKVRMVRVSALRYVEQVSEPHDEPLPRLTRDERVTITTRRHRFVLLSPFGPARLHVRGHKFRTVAADGPWRVQVMGRTVCGPRYEVQRTS
jgi:hypothetical protein